MTLGCLIGKSADKIGEDVKKAVSEGKDGQVFLLENLRFHVEEEGKGVKDGEKIKGELGSDGHGYGYKRRAHSAADKEAVKKFREDLTSLGTVYINDAYVSTRRSRIDLELII